MRTRLLAIGCGVVLAVCAVLSGEQPRDAKVTWRVASGGILRVCPADGDKAMSLPGMIARGKGLGKGDPLASWFVVPATGATTTLPRGKYRVETLRGLETAVARRELDLTTDATIELRPETLFSPADLGLVAGNTHLHLRHLPIEDADEYVRLLPAADGITVQFLSYLERVKDDRTYISNRYPIGELPQFAPHVLVGNGEEHRHNFEGFGQGFGHVMFLGIKELVRPVSLGPGITGGGTDDRPLRPGIDAAREQGGTVIWCHNTFGYEDVPTALAGKLDALNVFDGNLTGTYEDNYYRFLNVGLRLPITTGTDWFLYDFSRVYARLDEPPSVAGFLAAVKRGRVECATNGPLLTLTVDGKPPGDVIALDGPRAVTIKARGVGRLDFGQLELVANGTVVESVAAKAAGGGFEAVLSREPRVSEPGWFAVRVKATKKNECGRPVFAHGSPVYVDVAGQRVFSPEAARDLLQLLEEADAGIRKLGVFSSDAARDQLLALYSEAARDLRARMAARGN